MSLENHMVVEFYNVRESEILDSPRKMEVMLRELAELVGLDVKALHIHEFEPYGVSSLLLTEMGYVALHTWPEHDYATVNIVDFAPGESNWAERALEFLRERLKPENDSIVEISTGRVKKNE